VTQIAELVSGSTTTAMGTGMLNEGIPAVGTVFIRGMRAVSQQVTTLDQRLQPEGGIAINREGGGEYVV
jgi:hypothetical protein